MTPKKRNAGLWIYIGIFVVMIVSATVLFSTGTTAEPLNYNDVIQYFKEQKVTEYSLDFGTGHLIMTITGKDDKPQTIQYDVPNLNLFVSDTHDLVEAQNDAKPGSVKQKFISPPVQPWYATMIPSLLLLVVLVVFWFFMLRQSRGQGNVMGFSKAKPRPGEEGRKVTFADVAGADEEKEELVEIVEFLRTPSQFNNLGARIPKGVLLMGPPGTGKTLLARAVAGEAGVPFFSISGSDFVEMFVGVGASRVRDLFEQAKKSAPAIIFIDEIDAVGRHRGAGLGGGHDEREQTLNQLLVEMDGFGSNSGVIVIAATNRKDILDPALLRPGRFDRHIVVNYPDLKGREEILKVHSRNKPIGPDVSLNTIAKSTAGFTGADLENLLNEAALLAGRRRLKAITMTEIEEATIKVIAGPEKRSHVMTPKARKLTAYHESGHAITTFFSKTQDKVHQVTIIPRGGAGGMTISLPQEEVTYRTKKEMAENIVVLLGGRVAEKIILDDISTGASNDIERATATARAMVTRYGFSEKLGTVVYGQEQGEVFLGRDLGNQRNYSESVASEIDSEIRSIIDDAFDRAEEILINHKDQLIALSEYLLKAEKIDGETFERFMTTGELPEILDDEPKPAEPTAPEVADAPEQAAPQPEAELPPQDAQPPASEEAPQ